MQRRLVLAAEARQRRQVRAPGGGEAVAAAGQRHAAVVPLRIVRRSAAEGGHDRDQLGVHGRAVQALVVVVDQDLPVGLHLGHGAVADPQRRQVEARQRQRREVLVCQRLLERHRVGVEVDEQEALPDGDLDRPQAQGVAVDLVLAHVGRADQAAVEGVCPGVVGALDGALQAAGGVVAEPRAAVPADVVEAAQLALLGAHHDHALAGHVDRHEVAGLVQALVAAGVEPGAREHPLALEVEHLGGVVVAARQRLHLAWRHLSKIHEDRDLPAIQAALSHLIGSNPARGTDERELPSMRRPERPRGGILRRLRRGAGADLPVLRRRAAARRRRLLHRLRQRAGAAGRAAGAKDRERRVRRPGRLHRHVGGARPGGGAAPAGPLLPARARGAGGLRRHRREVHRRRGDGAVRRTGRPRGRRGTGGAGRLRRAAGGAAAALRRHRRGAAGADRDRHRRGGGGRERPAAWRARPPPTATSSTRPRGCRRARRPTASWWTSAPTGRRASRSTSGRSRCCWRRARPSRCRCGRWCSRARGSAPTRPACSARWSAARTRRRC